MSDPVRDQSAKVRTVTSALKEGKLPTTDQAVTAIDEFQKSGALADAAQGMSTDGKKVLLDTERLVEDTKRTIQQKFPNNELQNVIYYGSVAAQQANQSGVSYDASNAAQQLVDAGAKAAELARMVVTSAEFRGLLKDVSGIVQEVLRSNIQDASDEVASDPNVPEQVRSAAANTRDQVRDNDLQGAAQNIKSQAESKYQQGKEQAKASAQDAKQTAQAKGNEASNRASDTADATKRTAGESVSQGATLRDTAKNIVDIVADKAEQHLPEDKVNKASEVTRDKAAKLYQGEQTPAGMASEVRDQAKGAAQELGQQIKEQVEPLRDTGARVAQQLVDMPPEKRDEIIRKFKVVAKSLQQKPEFQRGFEDLVGLLRDLGNKAAMAADTVVQKVAEAPTDPKQIEGTEEARIAVLNAKQLIENFANRKSLDPLINAVSDFADQARSDEDLRVFWTDLSAFITSSFKEAGYIDRPGFESEAQKLVERGRKALSKYDYYTQKIAYEASNYADALASDRATQKLAGDASALVSDLFLDERGKPTFKPELLRDLTKCVPAIADKLAYLPIPRVEIDDGTYHLIFDNIVLHSTIVPKYVHIVTDTTVDATKDDPQQQLNSSITIEMSNVSASARDIAWLVNKHSGFWKAGDVGLADFDITPPGISLKLRLSPQTADASTAPGQGRYLKIDTIDATVNNLDLRLHDSHHDWMYKLMKPVLNKTVKKQIEQAVEGGLKDMIMRLDEQVANAAAGVTGEVPPGPEPKKGLPEWGSKAFDAKA
ncbi:DNA ligase (ATP) [Borealophlyctis nickersoniae]|nr:DNA ligase (ATP) [Borealophlyctis nickersoniae]